MVKIQNKLILIDTNLFIYYFQGHAVFGEYAKKVFELIVSNKAYAVGSIITLTEILSFPIDSKELNKIRDNILELPNFYLQDVNQTIALEAARIGREYMFRTPDAIHLATGLFSKVDMFITNNNQLIKKFNEFEVVALTSI